MRSRVIVAEIANETLYQSLQENPQLADKLGLSSAAVEEIRFGQTPEGYMRHHGEQPGVLQLAE
ncbi:HNH endonuclease [Rossellomorea vietnamensis]|uniref:HNH endonuclease n=1 Tax=Rossellomorea vietnamensis TaxID=218284 RepID=UPI003CEAA763